MDAEFWHQRWQSERIGFHREQVNAQLAQIWPTLRLAKQSQVLVPLCGKSKDMLWLTEQGHSVTGFELSPLAVADFFAEAHLTPRRQTVDPYQVWQTERLRIYQGDFFQAEQIQKHYDAAYDRAALIALPPAMRAQYVAQLARLLKPNATLLLVTVHYAPEQQQAPRFSVDEAQVQALFSPYFSIEKRGQVSEGKDNPRVASGELSFFDEQCFELTRK